MNLQSRYRNAVLMMLEGSEVGQKVTACSAFKACRAAGSAQKLNSHCTAVCTLFHQQSYGRGTCPALSDFSVFTV